MTKKVRKEGTVSSKVSSAPAERVKRREKEMTSIHRKRVKKLEET